MSSIKKITAPLSKQQLLELKAGDNVLLSGTIYTARDAAHKRLVELINNNQPLPIELKDAVIYYVGPTPEKPGQAIGSAGPTTSYRMDAYSPYLINLGQTGIIGKGEVGSNVVQAMVEHKAVYFAAIGGAGALISKSIIKSEIVCYHDLKSEAIRKLTVKDMPLTVAIDSFGNNLYKIGQQNYLKSLN